jgi:hypothetical protein
MVVYFHTVVVRQNDRDKTEKFSKLIRESLRHSAPLAMFYLENLTDGDLLKELFLESDFSIYRFMIPTFVSIAASTLYPLEEEAIDAYICTVKSNRSDPKNLIEKNTRHTDKSVEPFSFELSSNKKSNDFHVILNDKNHDLPTLVVLVNALIHEARNSVESEKYKSYHFSNFFQLFNVLADAGPSIRNYFAEIGAVGKFIDILMEQESPNRLVQRDLNHLPRFIYSDLSITKKENEEIKDYLANISKGKSKISSMTEAVEEDIDQSFNNVEGYER